MGLAMEVVTGFVTAPSTTFTAWTMASGNTLTVRGVDPAKQVFLLNSWADQQTAGNLRIRSPRMHDNVQGIRMFSVASEVKPQLPMGAKQLVYQQDTLVAEQTGSATGGDIETGALLMYYVDLQGVSANLAMLDYVYSRIVNIVTVENTLALGTSGGYSGEEAINAEFDLLKSNTSYALLGYTVSVECAVVRWRGSDTGNMGVGGPGDELGHEYTNDWFARLSRFYGLATIPIFNMSNKGAVLLDGAQDENGADSLVISVFAELRP